MNALRDVLLMLIVWAMFDRHDFLWLIPWLVAALTGVGDWLGEYLAIKVIETVRNEK